jgi:receptor expression-enhancing protein 1/2/3/4
MYSEAKLAFIVYLWYPKTRVYYPVFFNLLAYILFSWFVCNNELFQGTAYVYESFFKPYIAKHETEIDRNLLELRTRAGDMAVLYFQRVANYAQTRSYEILQYIASQSQTQRSRPQVLLPCMLFLSAITAILASGHMQFTLHCIVNVCT